MTTPTPEHKQFKIGQLFTKDAMKLAAAIFLDDKANFASRCVKEIIEPELARIDALTGQENDPRYLAYALAYVLEEASKEPPPNG